MPYIFVKNKRHVFLHFIHSFAMKTATWHTRLEYALEKRDKTWADLIDATGLKKPSVYAWKPAATKRTTIMDGGNSALVCGYLGINPVWLFHGKGASGLDAELPSRVNAPTQIARHHSRMLVQRLCDLSEQISDDGLNQLIGAAGMLLCSHPLAKAKQKSSA